MLDNDKRFTTEEAAQYLGFKPKALEKRRYLKLPPVYLKVGRFVQYRKSDLDAFLDAGVQSVSVEG